MSSPGVLIVARQGRTYECRRDAVGRVTTAILPAVRGRYRQQNLPAAQSRVSFNRNDQLQSMTAVDGRTTTYG